MAPVDVAAELESRVSECPVGRRAQLELARADLRLLEAARTRGCREPILVCLLAQRSEQGDNTFLRVLPRGDWEIRQRAADGCIRTLVPAPSTTRTSPSDSFRSRTAGRFRINDLRAARNQPSAKRPARLFDLRCRIDSTGERRARVRRRGRVSDLSTFCDYLEQHHAGERLLTFARGYSESQARTGPNPRVRLASIDRVLARVPFRS